MILEKKYAKESDSAETKKDKTVISNDSYAICEFLELLSNRLNRGEK